MLREFGAATGTLADSDDDLFRTVNNLDRFNQVLVENDDAVGQVNTQLATVSQYLADDREDLAAAIETLGGSLDQVEAFVREQPRPAAPQRQQPEVHDRSCCTASARPSPRCCGPCRSRCRASSAPTTPPPAASTGGPTSTS